MTDTRLVEMPFFSAFNDSVTMLLPDTSCWDYFIQCLIRAVVELSSFVVFCNILCLWKPNLFHMGRYSTRPINTGPKACVENIMFAVILFSCPIHAYFLSASLSSSLPFVTHNRGITWRALLFLPLLFLYKAVMRRSQSPQPPQSTSQHKKKYDRVKSWCLKNRASYIHDARCYVRRELNLISGVLCELHQAMCIDV